MNNDMVMSDDGVNFVKEFEHFYPKKYNDPIGLPTIGYGHLITKADGNKYNGVTLSEDEATELLKSDLQIAQNAVYRLVKVKLNQNQFDALVSWTFNLGEGNLQKSTLLKMLNIGDFNDVPDQMKSWNKAGGRVLPGLVRRRNSEANMFANGSYSTEPEADDNNDDDDSK